MMADADAPDGRIPMWLRILIVIVGIGIVVHEVLTPDEPRWIILVVSMVMMGLVSPDIFDRWRNGPPS